MPSIIAGLGSELIVDEIFLVIRDRLNDCIDVVEADMEEHDIARDLQLGIDHVPLVVEPVPLDNFYVGDIPSFVQTEDRVSNYPMVVVMPAQTIPDAENAETDQYDVYQNAIQIHSFARANPVEGPETAYRRSMRMAEAVHHVVKTTSLWHLVAGISGPMLVTRSEPWFFPPEDAHGEDWCWRAVMHQYMVKNYSTTP